MQSMQSAITNNQQATPASEHSETARSGKSGFNNAPNFSGKGATFPQVGDTIARYQISSAFGPRKSPCPGYSSMHFGTDVATPMYTPLYAIGPVEGTVNVRCWDNGRWGWVASYSDWNGVSVSIYVHLPAGECKSGLHKVEAIFEGKWDLFGCEIFGKSFFE